MWHLNSVHIILLEIPFDSFHPFYIEFGFESSTPSLISLQRLMNFDAGLRHS